MQLQSFITVPVKAAVSALTLPHVIIHELGHAAGYILMCLISGMRPGWIAIGLGCHEVPADEFGKPKAVLTIGPDKGIGVCCYEKMSTLSHRKRIAVTASGCVAEIIVLLLVFMSLLIIDIFTPIENMNPATMTAVISTYGISCGLFAYVVFDSVFNNWLGNSLTSDGQRIKDSKRQLNVHKQHVREIYDGSPWKFGYKRRKNSRMLYLGMYELVLADKHGSDRLYYVKRSNRGVYYIIPSARRKANERYIENWGQYMKKRSPNKSAFICFTGRNIAN